MAAELEVRSLLEDPSFRLRGLAGMSDSDSRLRNIVRIVVDIRRQDDGASDALLLFAKFSCFKAVSFIEESYFEASARSRCPVVFEVEVLN